MAVVFCLFRDHEALLGRTSVEAARVESPFRSWEDVVTARTGRTTPQAVESRGASRGRTREVVVGSDGVFAKVKTDLGPRRTIQEVVCGALRP